jgi:acyl-coenzyme A synthetase/AMP-(fatty) acid ligase
LFNKIHTLSRTFGIGPGEAYSLLASLTFDGFIEHFLLAVCSGARSVGFPGLEQLGPREIWDILVRNRVDYLNCTPALMRLLVQHAPPTVPCTRFVLGGDRVDQKLVEAIFRLRPDATVWNTYGPTEATIDATACALTADSDHGYVPIGKPLPNYRIYILSEALMPQPIGVAGEIHIGGTGLARGYLHRPDLTAERFLPDPFVPGQRMYKTGDIGRFRADGNIEFVGRNDFQVKVRGYRIETGEIEAALASHPDVSDGCVVALPDPSGDKRLVAYWTPRHSACETGAAAIRAHLSEQLPHHMIPAAFVRLEALPLTRNGKLDRKALPEPESDAYAAAAYEPPAGALEETLAQIWAECLGLERVGRHDNFFELGGHSLLAARVIALVRDRLGAELPLS